jgi:hypothetical protein
LIHPKTEQDEDYSLQLFDFMPGKLVDYMIESPPMSQNTINKFSEETAIRSLQGAPGKFTV